MIKRTAQNYKAIKRFVVVETVGATVVNSLTGMCSTWLQHRHSGPIPVYGPNGLLTDVTMTTIITGFLITIILTPITRYRVRIDRALQVNRYDLQIVGRLLPGRTFLRGLFLGILCGILVLGIARAVMVIVDATEISSLSVIIIKTALGGFLGLTFSPMVVSRALADNQPNAMIVFDTR